MRLAFLCFTTILLLAGCANNPPATPQSKLQQVQLETQTGVYSYLRGPGGPGGPR
jgi:hypothetical protein